MTTLADVISALGGRFNGSDAYRCPCHNDDNPSLSVSEGADGRILLHCHAGCSQERLVAWARSRGFDLNGRKPARRIVATYDYRDETGALRYQVVRWHPKAFRQRRPDGNGGWIDNMQGVEPLPYRLPELLAAPDRPIFIVEGEKDSDRLAQEGLIATCNHAGAGKWRSELNRWFKDRDCVILPDADEPGRDHAADVAKKLHGTARRVRVLELSGLAQKQDVSDWLEAGHDARDLRRLARDAPDWKPKERQTGGRAEAGAKEKNDGEEADETGDARPPAYSDDALGLRFSARHGEDLRFVADWGKWLMWRGSVWRFDETMHAFDMARAIAREASAEIVDPKLARLAAAIASAKAVAAIVSLARADRRHAATAVQWDADPWFLSTPSDGVDLRSASARPARREDHCTKSTSVASGGECPRWVGFLGEITAGDEELQSYLRRVAGYCLTGITNEHAMFFCYGTGANGKGVFIGALAGVLADYAVTAPMETFVASRNEHHPTDLAGLRGARLVVAQETERGRRWAESKIKALTGGDRISARFMRQDFFEFTPQFKLLIAGNHKPGLRGVDEAIRRRFHLIPFSVTIPTERRDPGLSDRLREEWPGILRWAIEGCLQWQAVGLAPPKAVVDATEAYLAAEDAIANWIDDRCEPDANATAQRGALFDSWKEWAETAGEFTGRQRDFFAALESRGFNQVKVRGKRLFRGLRLLPEPEVSVRCGERNAS